MYSTQELLKPKGYKGSNDLSEIINWLHSYGIFIEVGVRWNEDGTLMQGYFGKLWLPPYENMWISPSYITFSQAVDTVISKALAFLPDSK